MIKEIPQELLQIINFKDDEERNNFLKYSQVRSKELYFDVAKTLQKKINTHELIEYGMINDFIRLDKSIKNILYRYLSTYEEQVKTELLENFKFKDNKFSLKNKSENLFVNKSMQDLLNNWDKKIKEINSDKYWNIFKYLSRNKIFEKKFILKDLKQINSLRNQVMHHSLLLFSNKQKNNIYEKISVLHKSLLEPWKTYLLEDINESVSKRTFLLNSNFKEIEDILNELRNI